MRFADGVVSIWPGMRYLSILPTNHAIDFMVGSIGPFICGASVVHLRTLRPEFVRDAFVRYRIAYVSLVPMVLKNLERGLCAKFDELEPRKRWLLDRLIGLNKRLTRGVLGSKSAGVCCRKSTRQFGGELRALIVGGAFTDPSTLQFFYDSGNSGSLRVRADGSLHGGDAQRSETISRGYGGQAAAWNGGAGAESGWRRDWGSGGAEPSGYVALSDDQELTAQTIVEGWLLTGDQGRFEEHGHLQLFGRKKNMIVTAGGKNIYPEDIEGVLTVFR